MTSYEDIEELINTRSKIEKYLQFSSEVLEQFIDIKNPTNGFVDQLPNPIEKPHISTTSQCLRVILETKYLGDLREKIISDIWDFFQKNKWESGGIPEHNIYVAPQVLVVAHKLGKKRKEEKKIDDALSYIVSVYKTFLKNACQEVNRVMCTHGFILYWTLESLSIWKKELKPDEIKVFERMVHEAENLLFKQLAMHYSGSSRGFDVTQCAYYLLSYVKFGKISYPEIINKAIEIIFEEQKEDGAWELSQPFLHRPEGGEMRCSSIEVATAILKIPAFANMLPRYFSHLRKTLQKVINNMRTERGYRGWRSDSHWVEGPPEAWATALVYEFLDCFLNILTKSINTELLEILKGEFPYPPKVLWKDLVDYKGFKNIIETNIISPIKEGVCLKKSAILLFGPPGTGKTTIADALAYECKWPLIRITPANFLVEGLDNLIKVAKATFEKIFFLENAIILFDEFDEFVTARETEKEKYGRFITTAMLPWLQKLKENGKVVTIMTTNHIEKFDVAIRRRGRFDLILPVGPPEEKERIQLIKRVVPDLSDDIVQKLAIAMNERMTIGEILDFCEYLKSIIGEENLLDGAMRRLKEMGTHLIIDKETMERFQKSIKNGVR